MCQCVQNSMEPNKMHIRHVGLNDFVAARAGEGSYKSVIDCNSSMLQAGSLVGSTLRRS